MFRIFCIQYNAICKQRVLFFFSILIWISFISFSYLISIDRTSRTILNNSGESEHPCLLPDLRGNAFSFLPLRIMFAVSLLYMIFTMLRQFPSMPVFWRVNHKLVLNFVKGFSCIYRDGFLSIHYFIIWILSFKLLIRCVTLTDLCILKNPGIPGINSTWSWCMSFLMCCWSLFTRILLKVFASMFTSDTGL